MKLTPEDLEYLKQHGIDPEDLVELPPEEMSSGRAALATLKAKAGGIAGGGLGGMGAGALAGSVGAGPVGTVAGAIIGGLVGGFGGQKIQDTVLPDDVTAHLQEEAKAAEEQHPYVSAGTEIAAGALAGGGSLNPKNLVRAGRAIIGKDLVSAADRAALQQVGVEAMSSEGKEALKREVIGKNILRNMGIQAALNPAIDTGVSLATGGGVPSIPRLAADVAGGALFSEPSFMGKKFGGMQGSDEVGEFVEPRATGDIGNIKQENMPSELITPRVTDVKDLTPTTPVKMATPTVEPEVKPAATTEEVLGKTVLPAKVPEEVIPTPALSEENKKNLEAITPEMDELKGMRLNSRKTEEPSYKITVQHPQVPGDKGYVQVDEYRNGENVRSSNPEKLQAEGLKIPSTAELMKLPQGQHDLESVIGGHGNAAFEPLSEKFIRSPSSLIEHISGIDAGNKVTTGSVINGFASAKNHPFQALAERLLKISDKESLNTPWRISNTDRSSYFPLADLVSIHPHDVNNSRTIMEEAVHSLTSKKIPHFEGQGTEYSNRLNTYLKTGDNEAVKDIIRAYQKTAEHLGWSDKLFKDNTDLEANKATAGNADETEKQFSKEGKSGDVAYAMGDLHEFIAHAFKNEQFQHILNEIPSDIKGKSVWQRIIDGVKKLLGLDVKQGSMLEHVLDKSSGLIAQERPSGSNINEKFGSQIQNAPTRPIDEVDNSKKGFFRGMEATYDKVDRDSKMLGTAGRRFEAVKDQYIGRRNLALEDLGKYDRKTVDKVMAKHREAFRTGKVPFLSTGKEQEISKILSDYYTYIADQRTALGMKIHGRDPGKNPYYVPDQMNDKTLHTLTHSPLSPEAQHIKNVWADYIYKESGGSYKMDKIRQDISDYISALGADGNNYRSVQFGAIRRAQGYGLPEGLRETDAIRSLHKYGSRAAGDLAMFQELESKPAIAASLKLIDPKTGELAVSPDANPELSASPRVKDMMKWVTNNFSGTMSQSSPKVNALVRLVNNSILGAPTGLRDTAQMPVFMSPYINRFADLSAALKGIANFRNESRNALATGAKKPSIDKVMLGDIMEAPDRFTELLNKAATGMRKYQGREFLENMNRDITFSVGKELARSNIIGAKNGNAKSKLFLEKFNTLVDKDPTTLSGAELEGALNQIAKNFTDRNQGTYSGSGLPAGIIDSQFAPFLALQKWSVEKSNVIWKDVVKPFADGSNRLPLLTYLFGSFLSGAAIQQLNELMTNRKSQDPNLVEALQTGRAKDTVGEIATLMQLTSLGGIVGDSLKFVSDIGLYGKTPRNIVSFPTATAALDVQDKTTDMVEALRQGEDPLKVVETYALDLLKSNVQNWRAFANHTIGRDDVERSDKFRDVRVFNQLEGKPASDPAAGNKYLGLEGKDFKQTGDISDAIQKLPGLIQKAITDAKGDPFELMKNLQALKGNSFQTMPDPKNMPLKFMRYVTHLQKTQGPEAAAERLTEYLTQNAVNHAKAKMVP